MLLKNSFFLDRIYDHMINIANLLPRGGLMKKILLFLLTISFIFGILTTVYADYQGTIGTRFTITGEDFGINKPKVYVMAGDRKVNTRVETWSDTSITCLWTKKLSSGSYPLFVQPKGRGIAPIAAGNFTLMQPSIDEVTPNDGVTGEVITVNGWYFTNKKPKISFQDPYTYKKKNCKVLSLSMDDQTGSSSLQFIFPKVGAGRYNLILTNAIGQVTVQYPSEEGPNLKPFQPIGWSDKIVVSNASNCTDNSCTDSSSLLSTDTLYVNWAVANKGTAATSSRYYSQLYVDGVAVKSWYYDPPLNANYWSGNLNYPIGSLSAGTHTIKIVADSTDTINESNEGDNEYTKTITVGSAPVQGPNLTPYQLSGWSDKIVVSTASSCTDNSCTDSSPLLSTDTLYVNWAVTNNGTAATSARYYYQLYVDGVPVNRWYTDLPVNPGGWGGNFNYSIGSLSAGTHTIKIVADSTGTIDESNEGDNEYTKTITVGSAPVQGPNLTPYQLSGWSDKIVVSTASSCTDNSCTDSSSLLSTDTLYVNWAVTNNGTAATSSRYYTQLYVDGVPVHRWYKDPPLNPDYWGGNFNYSIGSLSAGTHTIKIVADSTGTIGESNEGDNEYTKTITVGSAPVQGPNLTPYQNSGKSDKIVVSNAPNCTHDSCIDSSPLLSTDTLYLSYVVINNGTAATSFRYYTQLYVDGVPVYRSGKDPPLNPTDWSGMVNYSIGSLSAGTHTIKIVADSTDTIDESNEGDNEYTKTISVISGTFW